MRGWRKAALTGTSAYTFATPEDAWEPLWWDLEPGDSVLVKGSRGVRLEIIVDRVAGHLGKRRGEQAA